jgi:hypothetical protein
MGLLDEAIREHLELKRRSGADPDEIDRLEHEALGPVRRAPHDAEDDLFEAEEPAGPQGPEEELSPPFQRSGEPALFDHDADDESFEPEFADPTEFEPSTEIAPRPAREPESDPALRELARRDQDRAGRPREPLDDDAGVYEEEDIPASPPPAPATSAREQERTSPGRGDPELVEQETEEYQVEGEQPNDSHGEDVLEETPEFLQDTPDHDRLWFEQRPPRDFDLGG